MALQKLLSGSQNAVSSSDSWARTAYAKSSTKYSAAARAPASSLLIIAAGFTGARRGSSAWLVPTGAGVLDGSLVAGPALGVVCVVVGAADDPSPQPDIASSAHTDTAAHRPSFNAPSVMCPTLRPPRTGRHVVDGLVDNPVTSSCPRSSPVPHTPPPSAADRLPKSGAGQPIDRTQQGGEDGQPSSTGRDSSAVHSLREPS